MDFYPHENLVMKNGKRFWMADITTDEPDPDEALAVAAELFRAMIDFVTRDNHDLAPSEAHVRARLLAFRYWIFERVNGVTITDYAKRHGICRENVQRVITRFKAEFGLRESHLQEGARRAARRREDAKRRERARETGLGPS